MNAQEFFNKIGEDYNEVMARFKTEERIVKYLRMFLNDDSFPNLKAALEIKDYQLAFRMAHTLKGVASNLGLNSFFKVSSDLTEMLRHNELEHVNEAFLVVEEAYNKLIPLIRQL